MNSVVKAYLMLLLLGLACWRDVAYDRREELVDADRFWLVTPVLPDRVVRPRGVLSHGLVVEDIVDGLLVHVDRVLLLLLLCAARR